MWLDGNIINACQYLIADQYPLVGGLVDTIIISHGGTNVQPADHMLQIHHVVGHWVVSKLYDGKVYVCDSLPYYNICTNLRKQMVTLYAQHFTGDREIDCELSLLPRAGWRK
ncbi:hypothetical protein GDO81_027673 [Engystomops pustulosus]|uniref:Uncharacterized protein n=1 Tax=Engystomops pustulosus TaxID=76066 RepID=A0AAV6Z3V7_ENGPU|nr:hypothetical protein GDO81_027673 [Engystomops pustulosus]